MQKIIGDEVWTMRDSVVRERQFCAYGPEIVAALESIIGFKFDGAEVDKLRADYAKGKKNVQ